MKRFHIRLTTTVFVAYCIAVMLVAFWPVPVDGSARGTLKTLLDWLHGLGFPSFINYGFVEFSANIVFFAPMGAIMGLWVKRRMTTIVISTYISLAIESIQELLLPHRYSSVFDVIANTLGAVVGVIIFSPLLVRLSVRYESFVAVKEAERDEARDWLSERWPDKE